MLYIVEVGEHTYDTIKFAFDDHNTAISFAALAKNKAVENIIVNVTLKHEEAVESADAVQGEWVDVENEPYCECSVCGSYIDNLDDDYAFCPRCGARMKGGNSE